MFTFKKQKKRWRLYLSCLVLVIAITMSGFLVFSPLSDAQKTKNAPIVAGSGSDAAQINPSLDFTTQSLNNLTGQFTDQALKDLISKNQSVAKTKDLTKAKIIPDSQDVSQTIAKIIDDQSKEVAVSDADILINSDNSKDAQRIYVYFVNGVIEDGFSGLDINNVQNLSLMQYFASTANKLKSVADILSVIKVPTPWIGIHKQLLSFFLRQENIFQSLAVAENDPLRYMIASNQVLSQEMDKEFNSIKTSINKKIYDENLI